MIRVYGTLRQIAAGQYIYSCIGYLELDVVETKGLLRYSFPRAAGQLVFGVLTDEVLKH